jgi:MFS transporter, DHA1 family, multidrug resistance protein
VLIVLAVILPLFAVDLVLPAMPAFGAALGGTVASVQLTLGAFAAGFAAMHLVYGPLADRYGRRPFLLGGVALFAVASLACAAAPSVEFLIGARLVQAVGAAAGPLIGRAVVRDLYGAAGAGRVMGTVVAWFGIFAVATPLIGGPLVEALGWRSVFVAAAAYAAAFLFLAWRFLPETRPAPTPTSAPTGGAGWGAGFRVLLGDRRFVVVGLSGTLTAAAMFAWISGSPVIGMTVWGLGPTAYAAVYGATVLGFVAMSYASGHLAARIGSGRVVHIGAWIAAAGGAAGLVLVVAGAMAPWLVLPALLLVTLGHGFTKPQSMAASLAPFPAQAATGSALWGATQYAIGAGVTALNGLLFDGTPRAMLAMIAALTVASAVLYALARPRAE